MHKIELCILYKICLIRISKLSMNFPEIKKKKVHPLLTLCVLRHAVLDFSPS